MKFTIFVLSLLLVANAATLLAKQKDVQLLAPLNFSEESKKPLSSWDFCLTGDGIFIIPDYRAGNIKVYEKNQNTLVLVNTVGRKGYGPEGLLRPTYCSYSKEDNKLLVMDSGIKKIFLYSRLGRVEFKRDEVEIPCLANAYAIQLKDQKVFISGYTEENGKEYEFYSIDLQKDMEKKGLLLYHRKYNLAAENYKKQYQEINIPAIGSKGIFDLDQDGNAYFAWEGNLRIIKIDTVSGDIDQKIFGKYTKNYSKPYASLELVDGYKKGKFKTIQKEKKKISLLRHVFLAKNHLLAVFEGPVKEEGSSAFWLQFYLLDDGSFQKEVLIPGQPKRRMRFDKNIIYSLSGGPDGSAYYIQKCLISE